MKNKKIKLFVEEHHTNTIKKKYGFRITDCSLVKMAHGWYCVFVNWTSDKDTYLFKTCKSDGSMWSSNAVSFDLSFCYLSKQFKTSIEIGIEAPYNQELKMEATYFENYKYGVGVFFAPSNWDQKTRNIIEEYQIDEKGLMKKVV
jgi:hypothetical protein